MFVRAAEIEVHSFSPKSSRAKKNNSLLHQTRRWSCARKGGWFSSLYAPLLSALPLKFTKEPFESGFLYSLSLCPFFLYHFLNGERMRKIDSHLPNSPIFSLKSPTPQFPSVSFRFPTFFSTGRRFPRRVSYAKMSCQPQNTTPPTLKPITISYSELQVPLFRLNDIWVSWVFVNFLFAHELPLVFLFFFWVCNLDSFFFFLLILFGGFWWKMIG